MPTNTIKYINYRSDLPPVNITFQLSGQATTVPEHDFILRFYTADESRHYDCRYINGECQNMTIDRTNNKVTVYIKNHGLGLGKLRAVFVSLENNENYEDNVKRTYAVTPIDDIILTEGNGDEVENITAEMAVNLTSLITSLNNAEAIRVANENQRIANELARQATIGNLTERMTAAEAAILTKANAENVNTKFGIVDEQIDALNEKVFGGKIDYDNLTWTSGKGIDHTGEIKISNDYYYSDPFVLNEGDNLVITFRGSSVSALAKTDEQATSYTPVVTRPPGTSTNVDQIERLVITETGYYAASCYNRYFSMTKTGSDSLAGVVDLAKAIRRHIITENIVLEGGSFDVFTGVPFYPIVSRSSFVNWSHTSKFIKFDNEVDIIKSISLETGEDIYIFCYNADKTFLAYKHGLQSLPADTQYIKFVVSHTDEMERRRVLTVTLDYSHERIVYGKNIGNGISPYYFAYECANVPVVGSDVSGDEYLLDDTRRFDMGYVMLPPNYSADGDPVPLVIFFHGSGMFKWKGGTATEGSSVWAPIYSKVTQSENTQYLGLLQFICKCGYAVADCCAMTDLYSLSGNNGWDYKCAPVGLSCYASLYNYIVDNFNIRTDGVYAFGKSSGGSPVIQAGYFRNIPLRAIALLNPAVSLTNTFRFSNKAETNWLLRQFGYVNPDVESMLIGTGDKAYVLANIENIKGWEPFALGTDIDITPYATALYKYGRLDSSMPDLEAIVDATAKYQPIPLKIWAAEDDQSTPYKYMAMYKQMVDQGNGVCVLRTMPDDTGGHMCTDDTASAITCDYMTPYGGEVTITVAFAEMIDWFRRW